MQKNGITYLVGGAVDSVPGEEKRRRIDVNAQGQAARQGYRW
jgi:hypothetical protein